ncbi:MAG: type III pantothenate kinase [Bacteroidetes bacterium]|nr:type III pantothenate kinase [Bacteroidota bacterium]MBU1679417.1 type III pantothenate kinase [Bacteroidota bacterium]MBU2506811.1 type III pantothenate kinase [Bacteroidota bacterium]
MTLTLDVGNSQIYGGLFNGEVLVLQFRKNSLNSFSSDEIGIFLKNVLRENGFNTAEISDISICSVVPDKIHSITSGCVKYFNIDPFFLQPGVKTGLKIKYKNPHEVGADRIANAVAATKFFPRKNIIIVDFGTATTFCVISKNNEYLGGVIIPGIRISMESLESHTAKLPRVEIKIPDSSYGKSTVESIQIGLYTGQIGMVKEITKSITEEVFQEEKPLIIGTGGFSSLFQNAGIFDKIDSTLVLHGLYETLKLNKGNEC